MEAEMLNSYMGGSMSYYEKPSGSSLQAAQCLFQQLLESRCIRTDDDKKWKTLGFTIRKLVESEQEFGVISETPKVRGRGGGFYIVKLASKSALSSTLEQQTVVLQAMHTPSDLHIHRVAYKLLVEGKIYAAAAWNTIHRSKTDLGKEPLSYFNAFTAAVARCVQTPKVMQLHAFDAMSHKINGDVILSSSRFQETCSRRQLQYERVVSKLTTELKGYVVLYFPRDIQQLGGTLNVNAKVFYESNPQGLFFHVEMSLPLRLELRDRMELRNSFTRCFVL